MGGGVITFTSHGLDGHNLGLCGCRCDFRVEFFGGELAGGIGRFSPRDRCGFWGVVALEKPPALAIPPLVAAAAADGANLSTTTTAFGC